MLFYSHFSVIQKNKREIKYRNTLSRCHFLRAWEYQWKSYELHCKILFSLIQRFMSLTHTSTVEYPHTDTNPSARECLRKVVLWSCHPKLSFQLLWNHREYLPWRCHQAPQQPQAGMWQYQEHPAHCQNLTAASATLDHAPAPGGTAQG